MRIRALACSVFLALAASADDPDASLEADRVFAGIRRPADLSAGIASLLRIPDSGRALRLARPRLWDREMNASFLHFQGEQRHLDSVPATDESRKRIAEILDRHPDAIKTDEYTRLGPTLTKEDMGALREEWGVSLLKMAAREIAESPDRGELWGGPAERSGLVASTVDERFWVNASAGSPLKLQERRVGFALRLILANAGPDKIKVSLVGGTLYPDDKRALSCEINPYSEKATARLDDSLVVEPGTVEVVSLCGFTGARPGCTEAPAIQARVDLHLGVGSGILDVTSPLRVIERPE